jgi:branched-chain amino acid transport system substrate-binding protein
LKRVDDKNKLSQLSLEQIRQQLNQEILMAPDGKNGK